MRTVSFLQNPSIVIIKLEMSINGPCSSNTSIDFIVGRDRINDIGYLTSTQIECVKMIKQLTETNLVKVMGYLSAMVSMQ